MWMFGEQHSWQRGLPVRRIAVTEELGDSKDSEVTPGCIECHRPLEGPWPDGGQKPWGWGVRRGGGTGGRELRAAAVTGMRAVGMTQGRAGDRVGREGEEDRVCRWTDRVEREQRGGGHPCLRPERSGG